MTFAPFQASLFEETAAPLISSPADSPVRTSQPQDAARVYPAHVLASGLRCAALSQKYARAGASLRTSLLCALEGLTKCSYIWERQATPLGLWWWVLGRQERRTDESESGLWPTPCAQEDNKSPEAHLAMKARMKGGPRKTITSLQVMTKAMDWPTPNVPNGGRVLPEDFEFATPACGYKPDGTKVQVGLENAVKLWPSPHANCRNGAGRHGTGGPNLQTAVQESAMPTPSARDWKNGQASQDTLERNSRPLNEVVTNWMTPDASDWKEDGMEASKRRLEKYSTISLNAQARLDGRPAPESLNTTGSSRESWPTPRAIDGRAKGNGPRPDTLTGKLNYVNRERIGQLNPRWVLQLMGYPPDWLDVGEWKP